MSGAMNKIQLLGGGMLERSVAVTQFVNVSSQNGLEPVCYEIAGSFCFLVLV